MRWSTSPASWRTPDWGGQVRDEHVHRPATGRPYLASRGLGAPAIPPGDCDVPTHRGQAEGGHAPIPLAAPVTSTVLPALCPAGLRSMARAAPPPIAALRGDRCAG